MNKNRTIIIMIIILERKGRVLICKQHMVSDSGQPSVDKQAEPF